MGIAAKRFKIGERTYTVTPLSMEDGGDEGLVKLLAVVSPLAAEARKMGAGFAALANSGEPELKQAADATGLGAQYSASQVATGGKALEALGLVVQKFDHATMRFFVDLFGAKTTVDIGAGMTLDKPATRDMAFDGDYLAKFEWLGQCLWMNYSGFFIGALGRIGIALKPRAPTS